MHIPLLSPVPTTHSLLIPQTQTLTNSMDPHTARAEAERWLAIAGKLLAARDFNGSKTFAIRARESDPNNLISDQILAVVDTLLAADKKINSGSQFDWYSVLQLPPLARDPELIAAQYRRLILLLNPDRNRLPWADYALRVVVDAWSVLSDPTKKWLYDGELSLYLQRFEPAPAAASAAVQVQVQRVDSAAPQVNTFQFFQQGPQVSAAPQQQQQQPQVAMQPAQWQQQQQQQQPMQPAQWQQRQPQQQQQQQLEQQQQQNEQMQLQEMWQRQQMQREIQIQREQHQQQEQQVQQQSQKEWQWEQLPRPAPVPAAPPPPPPRKEYEAKQEEAVEERDEGMGNERNDGEEAIDDDGGNVDVETFWTACPYCFYMYEYARDYEGCTLRCQNCKRGFHAGEVPNPPPIGDGGGEGSTDVSFCCWGFYPMGFSMTKWNRSNRVGGPNGVANWVPFSPMFTCPLNGNGSPGNVRVNAAVAGKKSVGSGSGSGRRTYVDDDAAFVDISDSDSDSDSSDDFDWQNEKRLKTKKKVKKVEKVGRRGRVGRKPNSLKENAYQSLIAEGLASRDEDLQVRSQVTEGSAPVVAGSKSDAIKRTGSNNTRKQMGRAAKDRGKLDLNVEVSNEVEDHGPTASAGNGQEEPIEGIGFFEGLDEFLNSLPILNVVGDGKVKPS